MLLQYQSITGNHEKQNVVLEKKSQPQNQELCSRPLYDFSGPHIPEYKTSIEIFQVSLNSKNKIKNKLKSHCSKASLRQQMIKIIFALSCQKNEDLVLLKRNSLTKSSLKKLFLLEILIKNVTCQLMTSMQRTVNLSQLF